MNWTATGIAVLLWAIPLTQSAVSPSLTGHDVARIEEIALVLVVALAWAVRRADAPRLLMSARPAGRPLLVTLFPWVLASLVMASVGLAAHPLIALREVTIFAGLFALARLVASSISDPHQLTGALRALAAGTFAHAGLVVLIMAISIADGSFHSPWEALIGFDNPRFLNHAQTVALPLLTIVATRDDRALWRRLACVALVLSGMLLFITYGRATLLALLVGLLTGLLVFGRRAVPYAWRAAPLTLLGMGLMWLCYQQWMLPSGYSIDTSQLTHGHYRDYLIGEAVKRWMTSPWFGVGPMHFAHWYNGEAAHPHNIYFQVLAEYGAPAALLILGGAARWVYCALRPLRQAPDDQIHVAVGLWGAMIGILVDGAFSGSFVMPLSQLFIAMAIGLITAFHGIVLNKSANLPTGGTPPSQRRGHRPVRWLITAALLWLGLQAYQDVAHTTKPQLPTDGAVDIEKAVDNTYPRFWTIGWF